MRHTCLPALIMLCSAVLCAPGAFAFADDDENDTVTYADSPQDRYEARLSLLESQAEARRAACRGSGIGGKSYCAQEIDKELRKTKRELKAKYEAEIAAGKQ